VNLNLSKLLIQSLINFKLQIIFLVISYSDYAYESFKNLFI